MTTSQDRPARWRILRIEFSLLTYPPLCMINRVNPWLQFSSRRTPHTVSSRYPAISLAALPCFPATSSDSSPDSLALHPSRISLPSSPSSSNSTSISPEPAYTTALPLYSSAATAFSQDSPMRISSTSVGSSKG